MATGETSASNGDGHDLEGDDRLVLALARGLSIPKAARAAKVSESTVRRRLRVPDFRERVETLRRQSVDVAVRKLSDTMIDAALALAALLKSGNECVRLGAARSALAYGLQAHEQTDLARRLEEIEARLAADANPWRAGR